MQLKSPLETVAAALHHACLVALPALQFEVVDNKAAFTSMSPEERQNACVRERQGEQVLPRKQLERRPLPQECTVWAMFPQGWLSTAMGDGGVGGQMSTSAYATVIHGPDQTVAVYWQGRFAYRVRLSAASMAERENFEGDLTRGCLADNREAVARYGAET